MAYKELATFNFVPFSSNISFKYKGTIVPNYMHRIYNKCTTNSSRSHHLQFMLRILKHRDQNMDVVMNKFSQFLKKRRSLPQIKISTKTRPLLIHYDESSKCHFLVRDILKNLYKKVRIQMPPIVHKSLPKIMQLLTSKRADIKKISKSIVNSI